MINSDSMVAKLFEAVAKKLGLELVVQEGFEFQDPEDKVFFFADDSVTGDFFGFIQAHQPALSCYLHKRSTPEADGFNFYVKKPFLPTEILDILKPKLAEFGITEETTSNIARNDLEDLSDFDSKSLDLDSDLDGFDLESLENLELDEKTEALDEESSIDFGKSDEESLEETKEFVSSENKDLDSDFELKSPQEDEEKLAKEMDFGLDDLEELSDAIDIRDDKHSLEENLDGTLDESHKSPEEEKEEDPFSLNIPQEQPQNEEISAIEDKEMFEENEKTEVQKDVSSESGILDKNQIDEVKKILEETSKKDTLMEETDKVENFENIDEKDIMSALDDEISLTQPQSKQAPLETNKDKEILESKYDLEPANEDLAKELGLDEIDINQEEHEVSQESFVSGKSVQDLIKNAPLESLKSLLDGMQLTINISFPNKKK